MISLKQLEYAVALADTGHFGRAAGRCFVTQPALSQQIKQVEEFCGMALFDRLAGGVRLTPFGREFVTRARRVLDEKEQVLAFVAGQRGRPDRPLRFGLIPTVAPYLLPEIFPLLRRELPDLNFVVSESRTDGLVDALAEGTLDLALIASAPPISGPRLVTRRLFADPFVLATGPGDTGSGPVSLGDIDGGRMLLLDEGHCFRDQAIAACRLAPEAASRAFAATSLATIVEFVANGQGYTLLPTIALNKEASGDRIRTRELVAPGAGRILTLAWREGSPFAATYEEIAAAIRSVRPDPLSGGDGPPGADNGIRRVDHQR